MAKEIPLTHGRVSLIDDEDYERVSKLKWSAHKISHTYYVVGYVRGSIPPKSIYLHRFILDAKMGEEVDHINGDGLDNRSCNLRVVTRSQNHMNQRKTRGFSKYKGVSWITRDNKWQAIIKINRKSLNLGHFIDEEDAGHAYDKAAIKYYGEYARLNFPEEIKAKLNNAVVS